MSKTPVMLLQEVMVKKGSLPRYDLVYSTAGTHVNTFTFRVTCNDVTAEGSGSTKKEAKHNAAKEMLYMLQEVTNISEPSLISITTPEKSVVPAKLPQSCSPPFVNAIGRLQEYCIQNRFPEPHYDVVNVTGPSHNLVFTMVCVVSSVREETSTSSKKLAKHEVAKKMLNRLIEIKSELKDDLDGIDIMNLTLEEPTCSYNTVREKYPKLTKLPVTTINKVPISSFHECMKCIYSLEKRETITKELKRLIFDIEKCSKITSSYLKNVLQSISTTLNVDIKRIDFVVTKTCKMIGFRLNVIPEIIEIGYGDTESAAEMQAIKEIIKTLILLLK